MAARAAAIPGTFRLGSNLSPEKLVRLLKTHPPVTDHFEGRELSNDGWSLALFMRLCGTTSEASAGLSKRRCDVCCPFAAQRDD